MKFSQYDNLLEKSHSFTLSNDHLKTHRLVLVHTKKRHRQIVMDSSEVSCAIAIALLPTKPLMFISASLTMTDIL